MLLLGVAVAALHVPAARCRWSACLPGQWRTVPSAMSEARTLNLPGAAEAACEGSGLPLLPILDLDDEKRLMSGQPLRWQSLRPDGSGSGFLVQELHADADAVWSAVSGFDRYPELIPTVRTATAYDGPDGAATPAEVCFYSIIVSRIRLRLDVRFMLDEAQRYAEWQLDRQSWVLADSTGYWRVQPCAGRPGVVRVWFCVSVRLKDFVPAFIVKLVSRFGLSKATRWLADLEDGK